MTTTKILSVNNFIQSFLHNHNLKSITPVEIAQELDKCGILKDVATRPGLPLRNLIRQGKIEGTWQDGSKRWHIDRIGNHIEKYSIQQVARLCGYKSEQPIYNKIKSNDIPFEIDDQSNIYFKRDIIEKWIVSNVKLPVSKPTFSQMSINNIINTIQPQLEILTRDMENVVNLLDNTMRVTGNERVIRKLGLIKSLVQEGIESYSNDLSHTFEELSKKSLITITDK